MLTVAQQAHLKNLVEIESERRPIDAALRSAVVDGRDLLLCAASNLECGQPQQQPIVAAKLREVADLLVEFDMDRSALATLRATLRLVRGPQLRKYAEHVRQMKGNDAEYVAKALERIADDWQSRAPSTQREE